MQRAWPIVIVVVVFAGLGVAKVLRTESGSSQSAGEAQARLSSLPLAIGPWTGKDVPYPEKQLQMANVESHIHRTYTKPNSSEQITVLIMFGESGSIGAHEPELCFRGAGFRQCTQRIPRSVPGERAEFWTATFETGGFPASSTTLTWGWGADGIWKASENPRFDFAGRDRIFKLYVTRLVIPNAPDDPTDAFLKLFVHELHRCLTGS